jgi:hypothetical protein
MVRRLVRFARALIAYAASPLGFPPNATRVLRARDEFLAAGWALTRGSED